jgi:hypothetical protein
MIGEQQTENDLEGSSRNLMEVQDPYLPGRPEEIRAKDPCMNLN